MVIGSYYGNFQNYQNCFNKKMLFIHLGYYWKTDASILVYKYLPERTGFNMYAENTQPKLIFLALLPCFYESYRCLIRTGLAQIVLHTHLPIQTLSVNPVCNRPSAFIHQMQACIHVLCNKRLLIEEDSYKYKLHGGIFLN